MKEALRHIHAAIDRLRRSAGPPGVISILEDVQASLMHDIFGASLAPVQHHVLANWVNRDWTLGPDEPMPHHRQAYLSMPNRHNLAEKESAY
jgi:hypothetical protein